MLSIFFPIISLSFYFPPREALWCVWAEHLHSTYARTIDLALVSIISTLALFSGRTFHSFLLFIFSQDHPFLDLVPCFPFFWPFLWPISFSCRSQPQSWESLSSRRTHGSSHWYVLRLPATLKGGAGRRDNEASIPIRIVCSHTTTGRRDHYGWLIGT